MVSVLMCTYNRENLLREAIESVLSQSYSDWELVIVDDGSTDESEKVVCSFHDERIRYIRMTDNYYYCYSANYGLKLCSGKYLAIINSDDKWEKDKLARQVNFMEEHEEYGACFTEVQLIDDDGNPEYKKGREVEEAFSVRMESQEEYLRYFYRHRNTLCHPSAFIRKEVLDKTGGFNLMYGQLADFDLWIRIVTEAPIYVLPEKLTFFRWHEDEKGQVSSVTREHVTQNYNEQLFVRRDLIERLSDEQLIRTFQMDFRNPLSRSHEELEFEKAFLMIDYSGEAADMKLMGMQKLDLLLRKPGAADLLREHFHLKMQDIYRLNQKWMYLAPDVLSKLGELDIVTADLENHRKVLAEERVCLEEQKKLAEHLHGEVENLSQERDRVWEENERLKEKAVMLKAQVAEKEGQIELYVNSTSWKLTAPLRKMMDKVRRDG
ncbi:MAG: glycosyltransferase [Lachnoclostridium sp.]